MLRGRTVDRRPRQAGPRTRAVCAYRYFLFTDDRSSRPRSAGGSSTNGSDRCGRDRGRHCVPLSRLSVRARNTSDGYVVTARMAPLQEEGFER